MDFLHHIRLLRCAYLSNGKKKREAASFTRKEGCPSETNGLFYHTFPEKES
jgi:hypothetical protein